MALLAYSDDFDLDDDGILRDTTGGSSGLYLDDDGIIRDDTDIFNQVTQWTDSGLGGDKRSSTSTLKHFEFPASFEEDPNILDERSLNISELEASRDFTFDTSFVSADIQNEYNVRNSGNFDGNFNHTLKYRDVDNLEVTGSDDLELFNEEYYQQLKELGVLVDGSELLSVPRQSLQEFESLEADLGHSRVLSDEDPLADYLNQAVPKNVSYQTGDSFQLNSEHFQSQDDHLHDRSSFFTPGKNRPTDILEVSRPDSRARSDRTDRTVSSHSFPEVSPEEALDLYNASRKDRRQLPGSPESDIPLVDNDAESIEFEYSQKDQESIRVSPENVRPPTPSRIPRKINNKTSTSPVAFRSWKNEQDGHSSSGSITPINRHGSGKRRDAQRRAVTPDSPKSRSRPGSDLDTSHRPRRRRDSGSSHLSTSSEIVPQAQDTSISRRPNSQQKSLGKARSQESFFEKPEKSDKQPKRILPQPNMTADQNFKLKCKSTTNISSKPGPVKPTHMSLAEITSLTIDDSEDVQSVHSVTSDRSRGELKAKLSQESSQRKQATELVHQLQKDYDSLLSRYALAELTIDQLRLGAKITLHCDSPTPNQAYSGTLVTAQKPQVTSMMGASRGLMTSSPAPGKAGRFSPLPPPDAVEFANTVPSSSGVPQAARFENLLLDDATDEETEGVKLGNGNPSLLASIGVDSMRNTLGAQTRGLEERTESFRQMLDVNQLSVDQQEKVFDKLRSDHDKLRRDYLQAKEDSDVLRRTSGTDAMFDGDKELEGELFRLGMKFDDIHEKVDANVKLRSSQRLPFQNVRSRVGTPDNLDVDLDPAIDQVKPKLKDPNAGYNLVKPKPNRVFDDKLKRLHEEYNKLMQLYRQVKQRAKGDSREQDIDQLVQKLWDVCEEAPDVFKLPREIQERIDEMQRITTDESSPLVSPSPATRGHSDSSDSFDQFGRDRDSPGSLRLSQLEANSKRNPAVNHADRRKLEDLKLGRFSPMGSDRGRNSPVIRPRSGHGGRGSPLNPRHGPAASRQAQSSPFNRNSPGLKKSSQTSSMSSLPDSGISEQSGTRGAQTKKQSNQSTREFDTDSGFIGSVMNYGSGRHPNLVLRHTASVDEDRLQGVEEGAVGGRESPGMGRLQKDARPNERNRQSQKQSQIPGDLSESDSDFNLQKRRAQQDAWESSSIDDSRDDVDDEIPRQRSVQRGSQEGKTSQQQQQQARGTADPQTQKQKQKQKPQIYYSDDSLSEEEEEDVEDLPDSQGQTGSRSSQGQTSSRSSQGQTGSRSSLGQTMPRSMRRTVSESTDQSVTSELSRSSMRKRDGDSLKTNGRPSSHQAYSSQEGTDFERDVNETVHPRLQGQMPRTPNRKKSRSGSVDSGQMSDSLKRRSQTFELPQKSVAAAKLQTRRYSKGKNGKRNSIDLTANQDSTFTVEDDSDASVRESQGHQRSRSSKTASSKGKGAIRNQDSKAEDSDSSLKVHSNSSRLRALQKEIERLKNDVKKVGDGDAVNTTTTTPSQHPRLRYDPENPFSFMEGQELSYPRRRANSFSGSPARQYDDWLNFQPSLPRQPSAAQKKEYSNPTRDNLDGADRRNRNSSRRPFSASVTEMYNRRLSQTQDEMNESEETDGRFNENVHHRTSRHHGEVFNMPRMPRRRYRSMTNGGRTYSSRTSSSEDFDEHYEDGVAIDTHAQPQYFIPSGYIYYPNGQEAENAGVQFLSQPMRASSPVGRQPRPRSNVTAGNYGYPENADQTVPVCGVQPAVCPHCGRTSYHTHGAYTFPDTPEDVAMTTSQDFLQLNKRRSRSSSRQRSRSLSRRRYYSPDRNPETHRYFVREFADNQYDSESEVERSRPRYKTRSRSVSRSQSRSRSRSRPHEGRHYQRSRSTSGYLSRQNGSDSDSTLSAGYGPSLDNSLHLASRTARDIDNLTRKMMTTVKGEITRHSRSRERSRKGKSPFW